MLPNPNCVNTDTFRVYLAHFPDDAARGSVCGMSESESAIQRQILDTLNRLPYVWLERASVGGRGRLRFGVQGQGDLTGSLTIEGHNGQPLGLRLELEVKAGDWRPRKTPTKTELAQEARRAKAEEMGWIYGRVQSVDEALNFVTDIRNLTKQP